MAHLVSPLQHLYFWMDSVHIGQCIITFDLDLYLQGHSAMALKKKTAKIWRIFLCPLYTAHTVLDGFYPYRAQMVTGMRGCVVHNDP